MMNKKGGDTISLRLVVIVVIFILLMIVLVLWLRGFEVHPSILDKAYAVGSQIF